MKVIKRSGQEVLFNPEKIKQAIIKANLSVDGSDKITEEEISQVVDMVVADCKKRRRAINVEEIQDFVENKLMDLKHFNLARNYMNYRYKRALVRKSNTTDQQILSLIECAN